MVRGLSLVCGNMGLSPVSESKWFLLEGEIHLLHSGAVDSPEVVLHGGDMVARLVPLGGQVECLLAVGVVAHIIVRRLASRKEDPMLNT